jgi:hypothetical protein
MKVVKFFISICIIILSMQSFAQSVGIAATASTPDASSILDVKSTTKGMLIPRMTTAEKNAIPSKATGLMVYDNTLNQFSYWNGSAWVNVAGGGGASQWTTTGSNIYFNTGNVGVNNNSPTANLDVFGSFRFQPYGPSSPGLGKVMTSDANGNVTWETSDFSSNTWITNGSNTQLKNPAGNVYIGLPLNTGTGNPAKLLLQTATNNRGLSHTDGTITLNSVVGDRGISLGNQNGGWLGTGTNSPLMLMTNDAEAIKIGASGRVQLGYNYLTAPTNERAMFDVADRYGTYPAPTLGVFGRNNGISLQANPAGVGYNLYNDASASNATKMINAGFAMRNTLNPSGGKMSWESFDVPNGGATADVPAGTPTTIMTLEAGGGTYGTNFTDRLAVFTPTPTFPTTLKYGIAHKQGTGFMGTRFGVDGTFNVESGQIGTQSNHRLSFFTNNSTTEAVTLATNNNLGIGNTLPTAPLSFNAAAGNKISLSYTNATNQIGLANTNTDLQLYASATSGGKITFGNRDNNVFTTGMTYDASLGRLGIGTTSPTNKLSVNGSANITNNMTISGDELISGNSNVSGNVAVGTVANYPSTKLYVTGSNMQFPLVAYAGNTGVSIKTNGATNNQALIGSASNHDLGFFTNNGAAAVTLKTNGDLKAENGIYSTQSGGLNIVPIGAIKMDESIIYPNNGATFTAPFYTNEVGSLGYGGFGRSFPGADDEIYFEIYLNPAITNNYTKVIVIGSPGFSNASQAAAIYRAEASIRPSQTFNNPAGSGGLSLWISYFGDNLNNMRSSGTYMIYGIK